MLIITLLEYFFYYGDIVNTLYLYYLYWNQLSSSCRGLDHHIYLLPRTVSCGTDNALIVLTNKKKKSPPFCLLRRGVSETEIKKSSVERRHTVSSAVYCMEMTRCFDCECWLTNRSDKTASEKQLTFKQCWGWCFVGWSQSWAMWNNEQCEIMCYFFHVFHVLDILSGMTVDRFLNYCFNIFFISITIFKS